MSTSILVCRASSRPVSGARFLANTFFTLAAALTLTILVVWQMEHLPAFRAVFEDGLIGLLLSLALNAAQLVVVGLLVFRNMDANTRVAPAFLLGYSAVNGVTLVSLVTALGGTTSVFGLFAVLTFVLLGVYVRLTGCLLRTPQQWRTVGGLLIIGGLILVLACGLSWVASAVAAAIVTLLLTFVRLDRKLLTARYAAAVAGMAPGHIAVAVLLTYLHIDLSYGIGRAIQAYRQRRR